MKEYELSILFHPDLEMNLPAEAPAKLSSVMNITDEVLRFLLVKADPRKAKYAARAKERSSATEETTKEGEE